MGNGIDSALWFKLYNELEDWSDVFEYTHNGEAYIVARYPIPPPPGTIGSDVTEDDSATYEPDYLVLVSMSKDDLHTSIQSMKEDISSDTLVITLLVKQMSAD